MAENKDDDKDVVEQLVDSITDYSESNIGSCERTLNQIVQSPRWEMPSARSAKEESQEARDSVNSVRSTLESSGGFQGRTADDAISFGEGIVNLRYEEKLEAQTDRIRDIVDRSNAVIDYLKDQQDALPGNTLDGTSSSLISGATNLAKVAIPAFGWVLDVTGWSDPVARINGMLKENREKEAKKILQEVKDRFAAIGNGGGRYESLPEPDDSYPPIPEPWPRDDDDPIIPDPNRPGGTSVTPASQTPSTRVPGPGTYLGNGAYDLNGDGLPDYYDYDMDGVPDEWVDSDGDGIPDIYDRDDARDEEQRRRYEEALKQIEQNKKDTGWPNGGNRHVDDYPYDDHQRYDDSDYVRPVDRDDYTRVYPNTNDDQIWKPTDRKEWGYDGPSTDYTHLDVDSDMGSSLVGPSGSGYSPVSGGLGSSATFGGTSLSGAMAGVGTAGIGAGAIGAGVGAAGSYFTNTPVQAQVMPSGVTGATGMAAGLKSASAGVGASGAAAGRGGMMGAPGAAGGSDRSKGKRQGLGYVAPKLEDDDIEIRSIGVMAGRRVPKPTER